jgi:hypothetical protein
MVFAPEPLNDLSEVITHRFKKYERDTLKPLEQI